MSKQNEILKFWFDDIEEKQWFVKDEAFDKMLAERFLEDVREALAGGYDDWASSPQECLALILLLDQFTRNIFRGTPKSFAGDKKALTLCLDGTKKGYLDILKGHEVWFFLLPMEHSEDLEIQIASLPLFEKYSSENAYEYAVKHHAIIERFGRFPHRNEILGRKSTSEEIAFLKEPGSSF